MPGVHHEHLPLWGYGAGGGESELVVGIPNFPEGPFHLALQRKNLNPVVPGIGDEKLVPIDANPPGPEEETAFLSEPA